MQKEFSKFVFDKVWMLHIWVRQSELRQKAVVGQLRNKRTMHAYNH